MWNAIGFDLDMTLVDTRPGIHAALLALAAETQRAIDADRLVATLGPPVAEALSPWFTEFELPHAVELFRGHMARIGVMNVAPLPGAVEAVAAARERGLVVVVVTSKIEHLAVATLEHAGLRVDTVIGDVWAGGKAVPLQATAAGAYVGDHPGDMDAAKLARIPGLGVTSGSSTADELYAAGATQVVTSLEEFPDWLGKTLCG
jgi:phosphoglycolate phosphatase